MQRLAQTNLICGEYVVAEKYLDALSNTFFYADWAERHRRFLYNDEAVEAANSLRFEAASYTVELPERWRDRVTVQVSGDSITVYSAAYPERELATYSVISTEAAINAGDIGTQLLHVDLGNGSSVEIAVPNYPYLIGSSFHQGYVSDETWFTADDSAELLDLQTNGALSQMQAVDAYDNGDNATLLSAGETMRQELIAGVSCREH